MFKIKLFLFTLSTAITMQVHSTEKVPGVIIELLSGETVEIALTDNPQMVYNGTTINLTTNSFNIEYNPVDISKVYLGEVDRFDTIIQNVGMGKGSMSIENGFVRLSGFAANEILILYSLNGIQIESFHTDSNGFLDINLSSLPHGIFIIKINQQTVKISKL